MNSLVPLRLRKFLLPPDLSEGIPEVSLEWYEKLSPFVSDKP